jgi:hypothetical protein
MISLPLIEWMVLGVRAYFYRSGRSSTADGAMPGWG